MKIRRRRFLQSAAVAGAATTFPALLSSCVTGPQDGMTADAPAPHAGDVNRLNPRLTQSFDTDWRFHLDDATGAQEPGFDDKTWRVLDVPHDWSIELPFDAKWASATGYLPGGIGWYRKTFSLSPAQSGKRATILFDGVYKNSEVWINGHYLGKRPYGYISFHYDLTPHLAANGQANVIAVRVDHSDYADTRWYNGSGIYRHVWLITTDDVHIPIWGTSVNTTDFQPDAGTVIVPVNTRVRNESQEAKEVTLVTAVEDGHGRELARTEGTHPIGAGDEFRFQQTVTLANPALWSPETPNLYKISSRLRTGNRLLDGYWTPLGVRSIVFDPDKGFLLNGKKTLIKGVCIHHEAGCLGAAVPDRALERRLQVLKEMGCNAIRTSHNPPAPELLEMCDRMGFMVMDEAFDEWARPKKKWITGRNNGTPGSEGYAKDFNEWSTRDIQTMVERDRNHPSIILWSIGNEIDYARDPYYDPASREYTPDKPSAAEMPVIAAKLIKAVKELDVTRPVTAALATISVSNPTGLADLLDVVGYNYQEANYRADHARYPARKLVGSENSQNYAAWKTVLDLPYANGQFLWTGIDYLGEAGAWPVRGSSAGVIDECGFPKPAYFFRQSLWAARPMVYLGVRPPQAGGGGGRGGRGGELAPSWTWPLKDGDAVNVVCYSNCEKVELWLNGKSLGEKLLSSANNGALTWQVPYSAGKLKAVGWNSGADVCSFELTTAGKPERIKLTPDLEKISADGMSLSHVEVMVIDAAGIPIYGADDVINFQISGPGRIIGVDSGDMRSHESFKGSTRKLYRGKCLVIIQSTEKKGIIRFSASAANLTSAEVAIVSEG